MINSRKDLTNFLNKDRERFESGKPSFKDLVLKNETWYIYRYQKYLRYYEYYLNCKPSHPLRYWFFLLYKRLGFKLRITIYPNTIGPGLRIYHVGDFIHVKQNCSLGENITLQPGVVFGNKYAHEDDSFVRVGDNVFFGLGSRIFGEIEIGSNSIIGANAVVLSNIPKNAIVSGVPAKVKRILKEPNRFN